MADPATRERRLDAVGAAIVLLIAGLFAAQAWREPPALYDPLGPGSAPLAVAMLLAVFALILLFRAISGLRTGQAQQSLILGLETDAPADYRLRPDLAVASILASAGYALALALSVPFVVATFAFTAGLGALMASFKRRLTLHVLIAAVIGTVAIDLLARRVLLLQLP